MLFCVRRQLLTELQWCEIHEIYKGYNRGYWTDAIDIYILRSRRYLNSFDSYTWQFYKDCS